ncbi:Pr6Pr family membrane protein [Amycolatopsis pithecellobii]|uniref:F420-dependent oxidoreductase n=1 Tax=Amycolatopsis pithecellobii TaxID=664692 RepID=A0A6N7Z8C8_9PSEU|nr:Pr6Pr family membrane protein [Amycolatopsis pithecellobii]MTD57891.1 F420-dependent oxidoreductase [Amycolatopsis pithecellobii]
MIARVWFALTALVVLVGLVVQLVVAARTPGIFGTPAARMANVFCYFTILSNLIVGGTSLLLALRPERPSTVFRTLRLDGVLAIAVTGVVYHVALTGLVELSPAGEVANQLLHTASPILGVLGWLLFGPHGTLSPRIVWWSLAYPLLWLAFTLTRGGPTGFYPYPFLQADSLGYPRVALNCVLVAVKFLALAAATLLLDRQLGRRQARLAPRIGP